jgi:hypothetical protein
LQFTPPAQEVDAQVTWHVEPLQLTVCGHAFLPEQVTVFLPATVEIPPLHEPLPLQMTVHWSPEHVIPLVQLFWALQVICELDAVLPMPPLHAPSAQVSRHWAPAHLMAPAQEPLAQVMSQDLPCEQSMPAAQPLAPQVNLQACSLGQDTAALQEPWALQSNRHTSV